MSTNPGSPTDPCKPQAVRATWRNLGPGAIIAASVIGSSVLLVAANPQAEAVGWLLWFVAIGCVLKVFVQVELARYTLSHGLTTLAVLDELPGPRWRVRWAIWLWLAMFLASFGALGGILGSVGQCLALTYPLRGDFAEVNEIGREQARFDRGLAALDQQQFLIGENPIGPTAEQLRAAYRAIGSHPFGARPVVPERLAYTWDDSIWAGAIAMLTIVLLGGRSRFIERVCVMLVCLVTLLVMLNLFAVQIRPPSAISVTTFGSDFSLRFEPLGAVFGVTREAGPVLAGLALIALGGLGASELIFYPYWCLEKGYARQRKLDEKSAGRTQHVLCWVAVMRCDALVWMLLYTSLYGALWWLSVFMSLSVAAVALFAMFFAVTASSARVAADAVDLFGQQTRQDSSYDRRVKFFSLAFPLVACGLYMASKQPVRLLLLGGVLQAIMLLVLAAAAIFFRERRCDVRLLPGKLWGVALWCSLPAIAISGLCLAFLLGAKLVDQIVTTINW